MLVRKAVRGFGVLGVINEMATLVDQAKEAGDINPNLPTMWIVSFYEGTLMAAWSLIASGDLTIDDAIAYTKQSFFSGCGNDRLDIRP